MIACGLPHLGRGDLELGLRELGAVQDKVAGLRRFGAAALDLAFVAAGRIDGYWERNLSPWDMAAGILIVREAGGFVTDLEGSDGMFAKHHIVAGNETIQRALLAALQTAARPGRGRRKAVAPATRGRAATDLRSRFPNTPASHIALLRPPCHNEARIKCSATKNGQGATHGPRDRPVQGFLTPHLPGADVGIPDPGRR